MRRTWPVLLVLTSLLAAAPAATAKAWFPSLGGQTLVQGQRVVATVPGCPGNATCISALRGRLVALAPARVAATRVCASPLKPLVRLSPTGVLRLRVPGVTPGAYRLVVRILPGRACGFALASPVFRIALAES
jgi:hypothetical protein